MKELDLDTFSPIQRRMLTLLLDGKSHPREELRLCIDNEQATFANVWRHVTDIRKQVLPFGLDVLCVTGGYKRATKYRLVRQFATRGNNGDT